MMAVFILACSIIFLLQFFISYCRSLIASSVREPISQEVQEVTGMSAPGSRRGICASRAAVATLPGAPEERGRNQLIRAYFRMLGVFRSIATRGCAFRGTLDFL